MLCATARRDHNGQAASSPPSITAPFLFTAAIGSPSSDRAIDRIAIEKAFLELSATWPARWHGSIRRRDEAQRERQPYRLRKNAWKMSHQYSAGYNPIDAWVARFVVNSRAVRRILLRPARRNASTSIALAGQMRRIGSLRQALLRATFCAKATASPASSSREFDLHLPQQTFRARACDDMLRKFIEQRTRWFALNAGQAHFGMEPHGTRHRIARTCVAEQALRACGLAQRDETLREGCSALRAEPVIARTVTFERAGQRLLRLSIAAGLLQISTEHHVVRGPSLRCSSAFDLQAARRLVLVDRGVDLAQVVEARAPNDLDFADEAEITIGPCASVASCSRASACSN